MQVLFQEVLARLSIELSRWTPASEVLFFSTHFYLFMLVAQWVERFLVSVFARSSPPSLLSNTALLLSIDSKLLVLIQHHFISCDSWPLHLFQSSHFWCENFVIEVSDLCFSSPSFSTFDSQASIFSDEFPCHTILTRFWVDQTHVFLICTNFPGHHQVGSWSQVMEFPSRIDSWTSSLRRVIEKKSG